MPVLLFLLLVSLASWAHPFGSDLYGHRMEVRIDRGTVQVDYLAEISTTDHLRDLRGYLLAQDEPGVQAEARYIELVLDELETGLTVLADGQRVALSRQQTDEASGRGDTRFTNFRLSLVGQLPLEATQLNVVNANLPGSRALFNTRLLVSDAVVVDDASLFEVEDGQLQSDASERWQAGEDARELRVAFRLRSQTGQAVQQGFRRLAAGGPVDAYVSGSTRLSTVEHDPLLDLVRGEVTPVAVGLGLLTAVVLGVLHGLSPGHGKALVAAYLVGSRRSVWQAVWLGLIVTATHTLAVYALGAVALVLAERFEPERVLPWLELASGVLIVGVGLGLVRSRWRQSRAPGEPAELQTQDHAQDHSHSHSHGHGHGHGHAHGTGDDVAHGAAHAQQLAQAGDGWRSLVALGVSGGLAPCPSAMVLLLTAIGLQRIGLGLVLVAAFSLGLAVLVTGLGIAVILMGDRLRSLRPATGLMRILPVLSAAVVTVLGVVLTWRGVLSVLGVG